MHPSQAIELGVPNQVLMLLATRLPFFLTQVDGQGRYPIHVACALGASSEFIAYCIEKYPSCAADRDSDGKSPLQLLCQGTWKDAWDVRSNPAAKTNMARIHRMLNSEASTSAIHDVIREKKLARWRADYTWLLMSGQAKTPVHVSLEA